MLLIALILFHIIGAILMIIIWCKDGTMEHAALYGDNFEEDKPSDLVFLAFIAWEIILVFYIIGHIGKAINDYFKDVYESKGEHHE